MLRTMSIDIPEEEIVKVLENHVIETYLRSYGDIKFKIESFEQSADFWSFDLKEIEKEETDD